MGGHAIIVGASGQVGRAVALRFLDDGWSVSLLSRGRRSIDTELLRRGASHVEVDRADSDALQRAIRDGADVLVDVVAYDVSHAKQLLAIERVVGHLAVVSSASVYRDDVGRTLDEANGKGRDAYPVFPTAISEAQATVTPGDETYSTRKVALERHLLDHASVPVTIVRPCALYGIGSAHPREWWFVKRVLDGRVSVPVAFRGESRFHTSCADNVAELIHVAARERFHGPVNAADPDVPTVAEIGRLVGKTLHHRWRLMLIDAAHSETAGGTPWSVPSPFVLDMTRASALGYRAVTSYVKFFPTYARWMISRAVEDGWRAAFPQLQLYSDMFDYAAEDKDMKAARLATRRRSRRAVSAS